MINLRMSDPLNDQYSLSFNLSLSVSLANISLLIFFSRKVLLCINALVNQTLAATLHHYICKKKKR